MRNKIGSVLIILGLLSTTIHGLDNDNIYEKYCIRGRGGYHRFIRDKVIFNQKKLFWEKFIILIHHLCRNREYNKIQFCREFWSHYRQDSFFYTNSLIIERQKEEVDAIFNGDEDVCARENIIFQKMTLLAPVSPVRTNTKHQIKFKADQPVQNNSIHRLKQLHLHTFIRIETPRQTIDSLNASLSPHEPGMFISGLDYTFHLSGRYHIQFEAWVISRTGSPQVVLESRKEEIYVSDGPLVNLVLEAPGNTIYSSIGCINREVVIGLYNGTEKVSPGNLLKPGYTRVKANVELLDPDSGTTIKTTDFQMKPKNDNLTGTLETKFPITHLFKLLQGKRSVKLIINFDRNFLKKNYFFLTPPTVSGLYEFSLEVREGPVTKIVLTILLIICLLLALRFLYKCFLRLYDQIVSSKDIPVLVYRNNSYKPDYGLIKEIVIHKKKMKIKQGQKIFKLPNSSQLWKPKMKIIKNCVPRGVSITICYEKFQQDAEVRTNFLSYCKKIFKGKSHPGNKGKFREISMRTLDAKRPDKVSIEELKEQEMIFELCIEESNQNQDYKITKY